MINKPAPFKGLNTRIPFMTPIKGRGCIIYRSTLVWVFITSLVPHPCVAVAGSMNY